MLYNMMKGYKIFIVCPLLILKFKDFFELVEVKKTVKLNYMGDSQIFKGLKSFSKVFMLFGEQDIS